MKQGRRPVAWIFSVTMTAGVLSFGAGSAFPQASSTPPPLPAASPAKPATQKPAAPRSLIQLTPAERQAIDAAQSGKEKPVRIEDELAPTPEDMKPRPADDRHATRIEQTHVSNRVNEVIVTPPGQSHSYVMTNREGQQAFGATQMNSGLSVPMFFRFEFGRPTPPASSPPPPPPAPSPSR